MRPNPIRLVAASIVVLATACASTPEPRAPEPAAAVTPRAAAASADPAPPAPPAAAAPAKVGPPACPKEIIVEVVGTPVWRLPNSTAFGFKTGMKVVAGGAPKAFHQDEAKALDTLDHAGKPGAWTALLTDNGKPEGKPRTQGPGDPAPGFFVSTTALFDKNKPARSQKRYVDATKIPYVALPEQAKEWGAALGDLAVVMNAKNGRIAFAIFADLAPPAKLGFGSVALADAVGIAASPKDGGVPAGVVYVVFPKSGNGAPRSADEIDREGKKLFDALGGRVTLGTCFH